MPVHPYRENEGSKLLFASFIFLILAAIIFFLLPGCGDNLHQDQEADAEVQCSLSTGQLCEPGQICVQWQRFVEGCASIDVAPNWREGWCGEKNQLCCPLSTVQNGDGVCRAGLVCQVLGLTGPEGGKCLP